MDKRDRDRDRAQTGKPERVEGQGQGQDRAEAGKPETGTAVEPASQRTAMGQGLRKRLKLGEAEDSRINRS